MPVWIECRLALVQDKLIYVNLSQVISMTAVAQGITITTATGETLLVVGTDPTELIAQGRNYGKGLQ